MMKTLNEYLEKHAERYQENKLPGCGWSVEKWALKLVEEVGEFAQTITKDKGVALSKEELCDVFHTWCCLANKFGISESDLVNKFNQTSEKKGSNIKC